MDATEESQTEAKSFFRKYIWQPLSTFVLLLLGLIICLILILLVDTLLFAAMLQNVGAQYALRRKEPVKDTSNESATSSDTTTTTTIDETYEKTIDNRSSRNNENSPAILNEWATKCVAGIDQKAERDERLLTTLDYFPKFVLCAFQKNLDANAILK